MTERGRSRKKRIGPVRIICMVLLVSLLLFNLTVIGMGRSYGSAAVGMLPYSLIPILSDSMSPEIKSGDAVLVKQEPYEDIVPGDIVVYSRAGDLIIHQVIEKDDEQFIAKGLDNAMEDTPVSKNQYKAKYILRVPILGGIWRISGSPFKFALLAVLIGLIIFGDQIFTYLYTRTFGKTDEAASGENRKMDKE